MRPEEEVPLAVPALPTTNAFARTIGAFRLYPEFRFLWASNLSFFTGVWMQTFVLGWVTYELTNSEFLLALFTAARLSPMLLGPIGGLLADRIDRIQLLIWSQVFVFGTSIVLSFLILTAQHQFWHLAGGGFLIGITQSPVQPARTTLIMDMVAREDVSNAVALNTIALSVTRVIGPALGGTLLAFYSPGLTLLLSSLWYVVGGLSVLPIRSLSAKRQTETGGSPIRGLAEGFRIVLGDSRMRTVLFISLAANICAWPVLQAFMPVFARDLLEVGVGGLGVLMTSSGVGAILGALFIASRGDFAWKGFAYIWGTRGSACSSRSSHSSLGTRFRSFSWCASGSPVPPSASSRPPCCSSSPRKGPWQGHGRTGTRHPGTGSRC